MILVRRRRAARLAAAVLASGLVAAGAIATAGPSVADDSAANQSGAKATLSGLRTYDQAVIHEHGRDQKVGAGLFEMGIDGGGNIQTYCIDIHNPTQPKASTTEALERVLAREQRRRGQDPLDPAALLPAGERPRRARRRRPTPAP